MDVPTYYLSLHANNNNCVRFHPIIAPYSCLLRPVYVSISILFTLSFLSVGSIYSPIPPHSIRIFRRSFPHRLPLCIDFPYLHSIVSTLSVLFPILSHFCFSVCHIHVSLCSARISVLSGIYSLSSLDYLPHLYQQNYQ